MGFRTGLKVTVQKRFEEGLYERLSAGNIVKSLFGGYRLGGLCCLCEEYRDYEGETCGQCSFVKFEVNKEDGGCLVWARRVLRTGKRAPDFHFTHKKRSVLVRKIKKLRKAMDRYVTFE